MQPISVLIIFGVSWVLVFLPVLSIGVKEQYRSDEDIVPGTEQGAPVDPMLKKKALWATIGATIITVIASILIIWLVP